MWIPVLITTVQDKHLCYEQTAVTRIALATRRWLSDRSRSAVVVLGNHPISVGRAVVSTDGQKGMCDTMLLTDKTAAFTGRIG
jgi:precorrin isomerase